MKVLTRAISGPQVSAMISSVSAFVPRSMPLLTKIIKGGRLASSLGCRFVSVSLQNLSVAASVDSSISRTARLELG